ncbi:MAG: class I SAM-dependent methyltransferase [Patescibacteria group bacterium]
MVSIKSPLRKILHPIRKNAITIGNRLRYGQGATYRPDKYWNDRLTQYGFDKRGVGNIAQSVEENNQVYTEARNTFLAVCQESSVDFNQTRWLDIGCGTGFYASALQSAGVKDYTGVDITDTLMPELRRQYSDYHFEKLDVSTQEIKGRYDAIIMIDVTQHIVDPEKFSYAMQNIHQHLNNGGIFVVTSWLDASARDSFYEKSRSQEAYQREFPNEVFSQSRPFRDKHIFTIHKSI